MNRLRHLRGVVGGALLCFASGTCVTASATAQTTASSNPIGLWRTIDDETHQPKGLVRIYEQHDKLFARIEQVLAAADAGKRCDKCTDARKNQPITGLVIMRNMGLDEDEYSGGDILDPKTGGIYRCRLRVAGDGKKLEVRGFIGLSLFGRSQTWERVAP